jgi:hypothetical protein
MKLFKITRNTVALCFVLASLLGCGKEDYPPVDLFTWKAKVDVTDKGNLSVNIENSAGATGGEGSKKVVDNDFTTKFLLNPYQNNLYLQLSYPKDWKLSGSMDGTTWVDLDVRTGEVFSGRNMTRTFSFKNTVLYNHYRISISAVSNSTLFQLSEWRLIEVPEELQ